MIKFLMGVTLLTSISSFADDTVPRYLIPEIESVEVQYYDQETGEDKTRKYRVELDVSGKLYFSEKDGILDERFVYDGKVDLENDQVNLKTFSFHALRASSRFSNDHNKIEFGNSIGGYRYSRVHDLIREKYEKRGHVVHGFSLIKLFANGEKSFESNDIKFLYGAEVDVALPEFVFETMAGVNYKKVSLVRETMYKKSSRWDNRFTENTKRINLDYNPTDKLTIGVYHDKTDIDLKDSGPYKAIKIDSISKRETGLRVKYEF